MGEIRSALDIAMERTADIKSDKASVANHDIKNAGKKAASEFLSTGNAEALATAISKNGESGARLVIEGALSVFLAAIRLPGAEPDIEKADAVGAGLEAVLPGSGMNELFSQVRQIFAQYLAERDQLEQALQQQFVPKLRAKQQELSKRYGQNIPIDPSRDPEFIAALDKNDRALAQKYEPIVDQIRARVAEAAGIEA